VKILLLGRLDGWMGAHMQQYADGFRQAGHTLDLVDYHGYCQKRFLWQSMLGTKKQAQIEERTAQLSRQLNTQSYDAILFTGANLKFDFAQLRALTSAKLIYVDMDGPAASYFADDLTWIHALDLLATVSKASQRTLNGAGFDQVVYLPHGVDTDYYSPCSLTQTQQQRFSAQVAFVGRTSKRRMAYLEPVIDQGLVVWGKRWSQKPNPAFQSCVREAENVIGEEVNLLYNASNTVLNILQRDAFRDQNTILSLQVFAVPASQSCLITEWVEELEDAFDVGQELLAFKSADELKALVGQYAQDTTAAVRIGENGRRRCLAEHTHCHRAKQLLGYFQ